MTTAHAWLIAVSIVAALSLLLNFIYCGAHMEDTKRLRLLVGIQRAQAERILDLDCEVQLHRAASNVVHADFGSKGGAR